MKTFDFIQATISHNLKDPHSKALEPDCLSALLMVATQSLMGEGGARENSVIGILVIIWYLVLACLPAGRGFGYY
jgi:hypothetical protein